MWICLNKAFFSIVEHKTDKALLVVRARRPGDIETIFPRAEVTVTPTRDYKYRTFASRDAVAEVFSKEITGINYTNFKNSVENDKLHGAYARVWTIMSHIQE
jgi:hypothetical protein